VSRFEVNAQRLERTIEELASIGKQALGVTRLPLSAEDLQARRYVMQLMTEAGLAITVDPVGNIYGKRLRAADPSLPSVVTGSHICTGTCYGKYDGTVGVLGALEAVRLLNEHDVTTVFPIEVAVFTAEEPQRFKAFMPGSQCVAGKLSLEDLQRYKDDDGVTFWDALVKAGYHPDNLAAARRTRETMKAYVEMHIEQGRVLDDLRKSIGIVTAVAAPTRFTLTITGRADHSGATPMGLRKDALCAAAEIILALEAFGQAEASHSSVATVGYIKAEPGSVVVVPGKASMSVDIRGVDPASKHRVVDNAVKKIQEVSARRQVKIETQMIYDTDPVPLSDSIIATIKETADELGIDALMMPSGAGHDAQQMANFTDAGMIFLPSVEGISHNPQEYTRLEDIVLGTKLLVHVLLKLGGEA